MAETAGFHVVRSGAAADGRAPLVLLHGSGGSERSLTGFGQRVAGGRACLFVRGRVPWEGGHAFFRRNPDRSLDHADLAARCDDFCDLLRRLAASEGRPPLLVGFSNGAVMAAAAILDAPALSSGAVLLRPLSPRPREPFPALDGYPSCCWAVRRTRDATPPTPPSSPSGSGRRVPASRHGSSPSATTWTRRARMPA